MNVTPFYTQSFKITDVDGLDPIDVYIETPNDTSARIIIRCWGTAWTAFYPRLPTTLEEFFQSRNTEDLLSDFNTDSDIHNLDFESLAEKVIEEGVEEETEELLSDVSNSITFDSLDKKVWEVFNNYYGDEWPSNVKHVLTPNAKWLTKIINVVKSAMKAESPT